MPNYSSDKEKKINRETYNSKDYIINKTIYNTNNINLVKNKSKASNFISKIPTIIFVLGGPCSGKGTQSAKLVEKFGCNHISVGELLRTEMVSGSKIGEAIRQTIIEGNLVPVEATIELLKNAINTARKPENGFLIDGFPRTIVQGEMFEKMICKANAMLWFHTTEEVMTKRLLLRANTCFRIDDNVDTLKNRFRMFHEKSEPVLEMFKIDGRVFEIDACRGVDEIFLDTSAACESFFKN